jgi:hypothetical protein
MSWSLSLAAGSTASPAADGSLSSTGVRARAGICTSPTAGWHVNSVLHRALNEPRPIEDLAAS